MAHQVILEPGIYSRSVSWVRVPPSAYLCFLCTSIDSQGSFSCAQIGLRKTRVERELATLDEKSTSSGTALLLCEIKIEGENRGGGGTTPVTTACLSRRSWKIEVCEKNEKKKRRARQRHAKAAAAPSTVGISKRTGGGVGRGGVMRKRLRTGSGHHRLEACGLSNGRHKLASVRPP